MSELKMPERKETDGSIEVTAIGDGWSVTETHAGQTTTVNLSTFNAWRAFGMLAVMLGIPLPPKVGKAIKF